MSFTIESLKKENLKFKGYIKGFSGDGKTYSSMLFARGFCPDGKIGIIDTLGGQANQYANDPLLGDIQRIGFEPPFTADRCIEVVDFAVAQGCEFIIFDSMSNHHDGPGGQLERAEEEESKGAKGLSKWNKPKMETRRFMSHIRDSKDFHFMGCYLMSESVDLKTKSVTASPIQTKGSEAYYTFHIEVRNVIEGNTETHPAIWNRIPKEYREFVQQNAEITLDTGAAIAGLSEA